MIVVKAIKGLAALASEMKRLLKDGPKLDLA
jgi:hypothetical protein